MKLRLDRPGFIALTVGLALLVLGYAAARALSSNQGLRGAYRTDAGELIHQRIDRRVFFDHDALLRSVYTNHWDVTRFGIPKHFPAYRVTWTGFLTIPEPRTAAAPEPGLWQAIYADASPDGRPIDTRVVGNASYAAYNVDQKPAPGPYSIEWYGSLRIERAGTYTFWTDSDDGSWLYVDGRLVVNNGGRHELVERSGTVDLDPGEHRFRVRFNDLGGSGLLDVYWNPPGETERRPIPDQLFTHAPAGSVAPSLAVDSSVPFRVELDGRELLRGEGASHHFSSTLVPGRHAVTLELSAPESSRAVHFRPGWFGADGRVEPLPSAAFSLDESPSGRRLELDLGALLLLAALVGSVLFLPAWRRRVGEYGRWLWCHRGSLALVAIVLLAVGLRLYQYDVVPLFRETFDEFKTGWIGWTLLAEGVPSGWSLDVSGADTYQATWLDLTFLVGKPKLHPPPLFPLMTGAASLLAGVDQMFGVSLPVIRLPAIACSVAVTILVYFLALRFYDRRIALVAALLYATIPNVVLAGRLAKEENLVALLAVAAVLFVSIYLDGGKKAWLWLSIVAAGLAPLTKETGFYIAAVVFMLLARESRWREIVRTIPVYLGLYLIYFAYVWWFAGDALSVVGGIGGGAWDGFGSVVKLFSVGRIVDRGFGSGWMIWLSLALMASVVRKNWAMVGPILSYVLVLGLTLGELPDYGWYRIPLYPFLCVAGAVFVVDMVRRPDLVRAVIFTVLALLTSSRYAVGDALASPWSLRWLLFFALLPFALHFVLRGPRSRGVAQGFAVLLVALFVLANVRIVLGFLQAYFG